MKIGDRRGRRRTSSCDEGHSDDVDLSLVSNVAMPMPGVHDNMPGVHDNMPGVQDNMPGDAMQIVHPAGAQVYTSYTCNSTVCTHCFIILDIFSAIPFDILRV